jgi:DNA-binding NarL/FixJ family response regulator
VVKGAGQTVVLRAIEAVGQGEAIFGPAIARRVLHYFSGLGKAISAQTFPELTSRERELLQLIAEGLSNKSIAQRLLLNEKTVRNHVSNIFSKLHVADRAQAIVKAREAGLGRSDPSQS